MHTQNLSGKTALVTGASRGIGAAIADTLAQAGATVVGTATGENGASAIAARLAQYGGQGRVLNAADPEGIENLIADIEREHGRLDILVNNAGITRDNLLMRMKESEWDEIMDINLKSVFRASKAVLRGMMKQRHGRIISITSVVGTMGNAGQTRALPEETRKAFEAQTALGRFGEAQDVADAVLFLASEQAGYITGQTLHVNGGMLMP